MIDPRRLCALCLLMACGSTSDPGRPDDPAGSKAGAKADAGSAGAGSADAGSADAGSAGAGSNASGGGSAGSKTTGGAGGASAGAGGAGAGGAGLAGAGASGAAGGAGSGASGAGASAGQSGGGAGKGGSAGLGGSAGTAAGVSGFSGQGGEAGQGGACADPPPEEITQDCQSVGYPEFTGGKYVSRRQLSCETGQYGPWVHEDGCFIFDGPDSVVDFRLYWPPEKRTVVTRTAGESVYGTYTFGPAGDDALPGGTTGAKQLYSAYLDQGKPGYLYLWHKAYGAEPGACLATVAHLHFGDDKGVIEAGDWLATKGCGGYVAFGYTDPTHTKNDGLAWSGPGGLRTPKTSGALPPEAERYGIGTSRQIEPGGVFSDYGPAGYTAWNKTLVVETLPAFTPAYGRDASGWGPGKARTYRNVLRVVMFHGTHTPQSAGYEDIKCDDKLTAVDGYPSQYFYVHLPGYNTYASEYYFARQEGLLQETLLYAENGAYWGNGPCSMGLLLSGGQEASVSYRDDPP